MKVVTKQGTRLLNFMMVILQSYLNENLKQLNGQDLKCSILNKGFKDHQ